MSELPEPTDVRFRSTIEAARGGGAVALVPAEVVAVLGGMKQLRVSGEMRAAASGPTGGSTEFRSSTMPYRGALYVGVHKGTREAAGLAIGDQVEVVMRRDDSPRVVIIPPELEAALAAQPELRARFDGMAFSHRREHAESIAEARRPETRAKRVAATLEHLRQLP